MDGFWRSINAESTHKVHLFCMLAMGTDHDNSVKIDMHVFCSWDTNAEMRIQLRHFHDGRTKKRVLYVSALLPPHYYRKSFEFLLLVAFCFLLLCLWVFDYYGYYCGGCDNMNEFKYNIITSD